jgi:hypothetical protein
MRFPVMGVLACAAFLVACSGNDEVCDDGQDNDGNGQIDCADAACPVGTACAPHGLVCAAGLTCTACSGNGGPVETKETSCTDGADNDCDGLADCADPDCPRDGCAGGSTGSAVLGSLRVASIQHRVLGARSSGYQEQSWIVFEALDTAGRPYPAGLTVRFTHTSQGGSFLGLAPEWGPGSPPPSIALAQTDGQGRASVLLNSGRRFALLSVYADATAGSTTVAAVAEGIAVVGAKPNGAHLGLDCRPWNVPALTEHDCMVSKYAGPGSTVDCTVTFADRHGIVVGVPTLAAFWSEAGAVGHPVLSPAYDPDAAPEAQLGVGRAVGYLSVLGQPLPWDVDPLQLENGAWEHSLQVGVDGAPDFGCGPRVANPRDGLVTVIAMVAGEEGFVDRNGDGERNPDEPFVDIGEPFVDANDNGEYDVGEPFLDVNENGRYDGPNGTWDAETVLWTETRIVYTGQPAFGAVGGQNVYSRIYDEGAPPLPTLPATEFGGDRSYEVYFADENFNPLSGLTEYTAATAVANANAKLPFVPGSAEPLGAAFRLLYCDDAGANCAYGPAASACTTNPCHVVPDVTGFSYGTSLRLGVDCTRAGSDEAFVTATLRGVSSSLSVKGVCP